MATTKRGTTKNSGSRSGGSRRSRSTTENLARSAEDMASTASRSVAQRPKTAAAVAAGVVTGIAAGIAGFLAFKRSGKTFEEFSGDIATSVKDSAASASARIKDGLSEARTRAQDLADRRKDGIDDLDQTQIAEEALSLKQTGKKNQRPVDPTIEDELKTGAISY